MKLESALHKQVHVSTCKFYNRLNISSRCSAYANQSRRTKSSGDRRNKGERNARRSLTKDGEERTCAQIKRARNWLFSENEGKTGIYIPEHGQKNGLFRAEQFPTQPLSVQTLCVLNRVQTRVRLNDFDVNPLEDSPS